MSTMIRLASLNSNSSVDGPGLRTVVWFQGCPHHCLGCHNPQTQLVDLGYCVDIDVLVDQIIELNNKKITLSGGEPFFQSLGLLELVERLDNLGYDIWCYTGYSLEECLRNPIFTSILRRIHYLIDGKFILDQMDHSLMFRGSKNQRVIDVRRYFDIGSINDQKNWNFMD